MPIIFSQGEASSFDRIEYGPTVRSCSESRARLVSQGAALLARRNGRRYIPRRTEIGNGLPNRRYHGGLGRIEALSGRCLPGTRQYGGGVPALTRAQTLDAVPP